MSHLLRSYALKYAIILLFAFCSITHFHLIQNVTAVDNGLDNGAKQRGSVGNKDSSNLVKQGFINKDEYYLGNDKAGNVIEYYGSLACPHCVTFYKKFFKQINRELIQTGKAKYIYRELPMSHTSLDAVAAGLCVAKYQDSREKYYDAIEIMMTAGLNSIAKLDFSARVDILFEMLASRNMPKKDFTLCMNEKKMHTLVMQTASYASSRNVQYLPTIFVNGQKISENTYEEIKKNIREY